MLECIKVEVALPPLACVARQLRSLGLHGCLLYSGCLPNESTNIFAAPKWVHLEELDLTLATIDAPIMAADMPALQALRLSQFSCKDDEDLSNIAKAFGAGSPQCSLLQYTLTAMMQQGPYPMFKALKVLQLALDPPGGQVDLVNLPTTLTALECMSASAAPFEDLEDWQYLHLHAVLDVAGACIRAGAPLQTLRLAHCTTVAMDDDYDSDESDAAADVMQALHGLTCLDLAQSPDCDLCTLADLVAKAPDLRSLLICMELFGRLSSVQRRSVVCSGLTHLEVAFDVWADEPPRDPIQYDLLLEDCGNMHSCKVKLAMREGDFAEGDTVCVMLRRQRSATVCASVDRSGCHHQWYLSVRCPEGVKSTICARVNYVYDGYCWDAHVCSPA